MKHTRNLLSLLLAALLILAATPLTAFAAQDGVPCYAVYVKNPTGLPASNAEVVLTEQAKLLDGTIGWGWF